MLACGADTGTDASTGDPGLDAIGDPGVNDSVTVDPGNLDTGKKDTGPNDPGTQDLGTEDPGFKDTTTSDNGTWFDVQGVQCGGTEASFPTFDKQCGSDADCTLVFHTINCCGTEVALGINSNQEPAFTAAEEICDSQYPGCGCAQGQTVAEDGQAAYGTDAFGVSCVVDQCMSHVIPTCDDIALDYFVQAAILDWCTKPDQCVIAPSGLCVNHMGCNGLIANKKADWTKANEILAQSTVKGCPAIDETCECPAFTAESFGCVNNQCVTCEKKCPDDCLCDRDFQGCPTGECAEQACEDLETQIAAAVAQANACEKNADCIWMELGPICGSLSCKQVAVAQNTPQGQLDDLLELGGQGLQLGCDDFTCGCGFTGAPVCIDGTCSLCPPDCEGSCQSLISASQELAQASRLCWGAGICVVPDVCSTCGTAVNQYAADKELFFMGLAMKDACGPCDLWCRLMDLPYEAACVSGQCEMLSYGTECESIKTKFDALVATPESLACKSVEDCAATMMPFSPFCTDECACAVITNKSAANWAKTLTQEYELLECPSELCACNKCMTVVDCVDGFCQ